MADFPHVALLVETSRSYGRSVLLGVKNYLSEHGPWSVYLERRDLQSRMPPWLKHWRGDGIIARTDTQKMADTLHRANVPIVELRHTSFLNHPAPQVTTEYRAAGKLVAEDFLEHDLRHFGCYSDDSGEYYAYEERRAAYIERLATAGFSCSSFNTRNYSERTGNWEKQQEALVGWVKGLPKPVGLFATSDQLGFWLLDACHRAGVLVPEEAAVIGAENDELLCSMSTPTLSSVHCNAERVGYAAAAMLARLMRGQKPPGKPVLVQPLGIIGRQSSGVVAIQDEELRAVVRFIREHACEGISVEDLLGATGFSRATLERRMRAGLGRSPKAEITRVQLNRVKELLVQTELSMDEIARRAGFQHPQHMSTLFKEKIGVPPGGYRSRARSGGVG